MHRVLKFLHRVLSKTQRVLGLYYRPTIQVDCYSVRHGSTYGGWVIHPTKIDNKSIVYSFGVGEDISFDVAMIEQYDCEICAFDPTPRSIEWARRQTLSAKLHFFEYGIADMDGITTMFPPANDEHVSFSILEDMKKDYAKEGVEVSVKTLATIMAELNHSHIDILKLDIEGAEYSVIPNILAAGVEVTQILVEFHHRFPSVSVDSTRRVIAQLNEHSYKLFYVSKSGEECSFIHEREII